MAVSVVLIFILALILLVGGIAAVVAALASKKSGVQPVEGDASYFDGGYFAYFGVLFLVGFVTSLTIGIAFPWMCCFLQRWTAKHTVINGKRMYFDGKGVQLIGKFILWSLLTLITFGIYGFWMALSIKKWITYHTHFYGEEDNNSYFDGGILGLIGTNILSTLVLFVPVVGAAWSQIIRLRWYTKHTVVDSRRLNFEGTVGNLFVKHLIWGLLTVITFGIFAFFLPVKTTRWETEHTIDHEHTAAALQEKALYKNAVQTDGANLNSHRVEDEMEAVKAGVTDTLSEADLLALANGGNRAAKYEYVARYGAENPAADPYAQLLTDAALADYGPAMSLYAAANDLPYETRKDLMTRAAERGQVAAVSACFDIYADEALANGKDTAKLKTAIRYADLLHELGQEMSDAQQQREKQCVLALRKLVSGVAPKQGSVGVLVAIIIAAVVLVVGAISAASLLLFKGIAVEAPMRAPAQNAIGDVVDSAVAADQPAAVGSIY